MSGAPLTYALHNEAIAAELTEAVLEKMRGDMQDAYDQVFAPRWYTLPVDVRIGNDPASSRVLHLVNELDDPEALAYHTVDASGRPVLRLGVDAIRASLAEGANLLDEITKALSHEIFETAVNPFVCLFAWVPGYNILQSYEVCDPVQGGSWRLRPDAFAMSDFVLPAYWDAEDLDGPYNYGETLVAPLSCAPDGYRAWSDGTQTFGAAVPARRRAAAALMGSRFSRFRRLTAKHANAAPA